MRWLFGIPEHKMDILWAAIGAIALLILILVLSDEARAESEAKPETLPEPIILVKRETRHGAAITGVSSNKVINLTTRRGRRIQVTTGIVGDQVITITTKTAKKKKEKDDE